MQTQRVKIGDIEIACSEAGEGPPLVFVHGFTGHRDDFEPHLDALGRTSHVFAPDLRGHGDATHTGRPDTFTFETLVRDLEALLDVLEIHACDLLGASRALDLLNTSSDRLSRNPHYSRTYTFFLKIVPTWSTSVIWFSLVRQAITEIEVDFKSWRPIHPNNRCHSSCHSISS